MLVRISHAHVHLLNRLALGMHMPNLVKVLFLMKELDIKYECKYLE